MILTSGVFTADWERVGDGRQASGRRSKPFPNHRSMKPHDPPVPRSAAGLHPCPVCAAGCCQRHPRQAVCGARPGGGHLGFFCIGTPCGDNRAGVGCGKDASYGRLFFGSRLAGSRSLAGVADSPPFTARLSRGVCASSRDINGCHTDSSVWAWRGVAASEGSHWHFLRQPPQAVATG